MRPFANPRPRPARSSPAAAPCRCSRKAAAARVAISADVEHQLPNRISRIPAVAQHVIKRRIAQVVWSWRKAVSRSANGCFGISHSRTVSRSATKTGCRTGLGPPNQALRLRRFRGGSPAPSHDRAAAASGCIANLVAEVVGNPAVRVHVVEVLVQMLGQKPGCDREIFVVRVRQARAVGTRLRQRGRMSGIAYSGGNAGQSGRRGNGIVFRAQMTWTQHSNYALSRRIVRNRGTNGVEGTIRTSSRVRSVKGLPRLLGRHGDLVARDDEV